LPVHLTRVIHCLIRFSGRIMRRLPSGIDQLDIRMRHDGGGLVQRESDNPLASRTRRKHKHLPVPEEHALSPSRHRPTWDYRPHHHRLKPPSQVMSGALPLLAFLGPPPSSSPTVGQPRQATVSHVPSSATTSQSMSWQRSRTSFPGPNPDSPKRQYWRFASTAPG
jgi:hypothetical protein